MSGWTWSPDDSGWQNPVRRAFFLYQEMGYLHTQLLPSIGDKIASSAQALRPGHEERQLLSVKLIYEKKPVNKIVRSIVIAGIRTDASKILHHIIIRGQ